MIRTGWSRFVVVLVVGAMLLFGSVSVAAGAPDKAAAKARGKPSGGTLSLVVLDGATEARYGGRITFDVSTTSTDQPYVNVRCYQGSAFVYDGWAGFFEGAWFGQTFTLSSASWQGEGADCTARLVMWGRNGRERTLATLAFDVAP